MPKGDRQKLKADPEDGTTPIANLLLEAVAMAKLSGQEKGAILYLWRQTYGWAEADKKRRKECKLTLSEWGKALDITRFRASDILANLVSKNIFFRRTADQWGGYYYHLNTDIAKWNSNTINLAKLAESVNIVDFGDIPTPPPVTKKDTVIVNATVSLKDTVTEEATVTKKNTEQLQKTVTPQLQRTTHPTLYKESIKKGKERGAGLNNPPLYQETGRVFALLDKNRGYKTTKRDAEAASITRMLKKGYSAEEIIGTWETLKVDKFYQGKELFMMTVEGQIGAVLKKLEPAQDAPAPKGVEVVR